MAIIFTCICGKSIEISEEYGGKRVRCPFCSAIVVAPEQPVSVEQPEAAPSRVAPVAPTRRRIPTRGARRAPGGRGGFSGRRGTGRERQYDEPRGRFSSSRPRTARRSPAVPIIIAVCLIALIAVILYFAGGGGGPKYYSPREAIEQFLDAMCQGRTVDAGNCLDPASSDQSSHSAIKFLSGKLNANTDGKGLAYTLFEPDVEWKEGRAKVEARISLQTQEKGEIIVNTVFWSVRTRGFWYILPK